MTTERERVIPVPRNKRRKVRAANLIALQHTLVLGLGDLLGPCLRPVAQRTAFAHLLERRYCRHPIARRRVRNGRRSPIQSARSTRRVPTATGPRRNRCRRSRRSMIAPTSATTAAAASWRRRAQDRAPVVNASADLLDLVGARIGTDEDLLEGGGRIRCVGSPGWRRNRPATRRRTALSAPAAESVRNSIF